MRAIAAIVLGLAVVALAGCGTNDEPAEAEPEPELWTAPPQPEEDGTVPVEEFNELIEERDPDWARTVLMAAAAFVGERDRAPGEGGELSIVAEPPEREDERRVVVTDDELPDDSIRAARWELRFERAGDGTWRLADARWSQRCQPGRGHQDFQPELCV